MKYNTPAEQCAFQQYYPYYYYQFAPGDGPGTVAETITDGVITTLSYSGGDAGSSVYANSQTTYACSFDYSGEADGPGPAGPNCCGGSYWLTVTTVTTGSPNTVSPPTLMQWGGDFTNCLAGPAVASQPKDVAGYPEPVLTFLNDTTINSTYVVPAPIQQIYKSTNVYASNYWAGSYTVSESNPIPASVPLAFWPSNPAKVSGTHSAPPANPWYEWDCLDDSGDYVNRIRVLVRSWSSNSAFAQQGTAGIAGPQGPPFSDHDLLNWPTWPLVIDSFPAPTNAPPYYQTISSQLEVGWGDLFPGFYN
jgi:hypothetical protein